MDANVMITVVVPVYNSVQYLAECLLSVVGQTFADWQLVVVDDGSTDGSAELAKRIAANNPSCDIQVICQENQGVNVARRVGVQHAKGELCTFLDSDDFYLDEEALDKLARAFRKYGYDICLMDAYREKWGHACIDFSWKSGPVDAQVARETLCSIWTPQGNCDLGYIFKAFRTELFPFDFDAGIPLFEDRLLWYRMFDKAKSFYLVNEMLYFYRNTENSVASQLITNQRLDCYLQVVAKTDEYMDAWNVSDDCRRDTKISRVHTLLEYVAFACESKDPLRSLAMLREHPLYDALNVDDPYLWPEHRKVLDVFHGRDFNQVIKLQSELPKSAPKKNLADAVAGKAASFVRNRMRAKKFSDYREAGLSYTGAFRKLSVVRVVLDEATKDYDTVQAFVEYIASDAGDTEKLQVEVLNPNGDRVAHYNYLVLDSRIVQNPETGESVCRVYFSLRKAAALWEFFLQVTLEGADSQAIMYLNDAAVRKVYFRHNFDLDLSGDGSGYHDWFLAHKVTDDELQRQRESTFAINPKFSVIVPLFNTPIGFFQEMAQSVLRQSYGNLELVLANASPENAELRRAIECLQASDERVVVKTLEGNGGISANTEAGVQAATGDFLCFFDHDDVLELDALYEYAKAVNEHPDVDLLFCDEDKLRNGEYVGGYFKSDYDPLLMLDCNNVTHLLTVRKEAYERAGGFSGPEYDGSQDHDLTIRVAEVANGIYHVRKMLYHWRMHAASASANAEAKPWTLESGRLAVQNHLDRLGVGATVRNYPSFPDCYRIDFDMPTSHPLVSIAVAANDAEQLKRCLQSVKNKTSYGKYEVIVAVVGDDASLIREHAQAVAGDALVVDCAEAPSVYAALNIAAEKASGEYLCFVSQDFAVESSDWMLRLLGVFSYPNVAVCGPRVLNADETMRSLGIVVHYGVPVRLCEFSSRNDRRCYTMTRFLRSVTAVDCTCMMVRAQTFKDADGFDEAFVTDLGAVEFCMRVGQDDSIIAVEPLAEVRSLRYSPVANAGLTQLLLDESETARAQYDHEREMLTERWPARLSGPDPHYNPNLAVGRGNFELVD